MNRSGWIQWAFEWAVQAGACDQALTRAAVEAIADRGDREGWGWPPSTRGAMRALWAWAEAAAPPGLPGPGMDAEHTRSWGESRHRQQAALWLQDRIGGDEVLDTLGEVERLESQGLTGLLAHPCSAAMTDTAADYYGQRCCRPGREVHPPLVSGRPVDPILACGEHAEEVREATRQQARRDWHRVATLPLLDDPREDYATIERAGLMGLDSRHVYLIIRPTMDDEADPRCRWTAALGIGSYLTAVRRLGAPASGRRVGRRVRGAASWDTREEAEAAALAAWAGAVEERVEEIREARGGTLDWGLAVEARAEPIVLRIPYRGNAWDYLPEGRS